MDASIQAAMRADALLDQGDMRPYQHRRAGGLPAPICRRLSLARHHGRFFNDGRKALALVRYRNRVRSLVRKLVRSVNNAVLRHFGHLCKNKELPTCEKPMMGSFCFAKPL